MVLFEPGWNGLYVGNLVLMNPHTMWGKTRIEKRRMLDPKI